MSWYEDLLSTKKMNSEGLFKLIEEVLELDRPILNGSEKTDTQVLKEQFLNEKEGVTLTLQAIPDIAVSELGWTDITGKGVTEVEGPARQRLSQFLQNVQGGDFVEKVRSLSRFYEDPDTAMTMMFPDGEAKNTAEQIKVALSYMVFYKTLTKVISNFNAASAGFNFEAFLAAVSYTHLTLPTKRIV